MSECRICSKNAVTVSHKGTQERPVANVKNGSLLRKQSLTISSWNLELQVSVQDCSPWHGRNSQGQGTEENGILSQ